MEINLELNHEAGEKLLYIQQQTKQELREAIESSIELLYEQIKHRNDPLAKLKNSPFIGSFEAEPDLAVNSNLLY